MSPTEKVNGVAYWRGTVDSKLDSLEEKADHQTDQMDRLIDKVDSIAKQQNEDKGKFVEWQYIRDKFTVPVVLGTILFILFTIMPAAIVLIYR